MDYDFRAGFLAGYDNSAKCWCGTGSVGRLEGCSTEKHRPHRPFGILHSCLQYNTLFHIAFQAQAPDDLSVRRGDWIYADLNNQTVDGWLWAYSPKSRKHGFIPKAYARPPAMTSL